MADLRDIEIEVLKFNQRNEMLADLYPVLRLLQHAQAAGSLYCTARQDQWKRLQDAKQLVCDVLEEVKADNTKYRDANV